MSKPSENHTVIPEFTIIEDNNAQFTGINIVGKTISDMILLGGVAGKDNLKVDGYLLICFTDGNILGLSAYDETFYANYNYRTDTEEFRQETANRSLNGPFAEKTVGKEVVSSSFNGKAILGSPQTLSIELDNGTDILFEATFTDNILNVSLQHRKGRTGGSAI